MDGFPGIKEAVRWTGFPGIKQLPSSGATQRAPPTCRCTASSRQGSNWCANTNQKFVQIPTARLKDRISQLCKQYGLKFVETEESYTSKASFLDDDVLPKYGEKPKGWKTSGKRVNRGLYRCAKGIKINADCNGAANILRKVSVKLGLNLSGISRGALIAPLRVCLWTIQESPGF